METKNEITFVEQCQTLNDFWQFTQIIHRQKPRVISLQEMYKYGELIAKDTWVKTEHELPEIDQCFNAVIHGKIEYDCGAYVGQWSDDDRRKTMLIKGITHWQPLLALPQ